MSTFSREMIRFVVTRQTENNTNGKVLTSILLPIIFATQGAIIGCSVCRDSELSTPLALFVPYPNPAL
jgi:hypothetical protein